MLTRSKTRHLLLNEIIDRDRLFRGLRKEHNFGSVQATELFETSSGCFKVFPDEKISPECMFSSIEATHFGLPEDMDGTLSALCIEDGKVSLTTTFTKIRSENDLYLFQSWFTKKEFECAKQSKPFRYLLHYTEWGYEESLGTYLDGADKKILIPHELEFSLFSNAIEEYVQLIEMPDRHSPVQYTPVPSPVAQSTQDWLKMLRSYPDVSESTSSLSSPPSGNKTIATDVLRRSEATSPVDTSGGWDEEPIDWTVDLDDNEDESPENRGAQLRLPDNFNPCDWEEDESINYGPTAILKSRVLEHVPILPALWQFEYAESSPEKLAVEIVRHDIADAFFERTRPSPRVLHFREIYRTLLYEERATRAENAPDYIAQAKDPD